jgi:predicted nucleotidyltransferase
MQAKQYLPITKRHKAPVFVYNTFMTKTALSLTPKEIAAYRRAASQVKPKRRATVKARHTRAWQIARKAARILKTEFGVEKLMVFGSLVHPALFHERSDVDLAVWGLVGRAYYRAVSVLLDIEPSISVDLIAFEDARPALREVILRDGREL